MSTGVLQTELTTVYRFSVDEYHRLLDAHVLDHPEEVEFIAGLLVPKMSRKPPHDSTLDKLEDLIRALLPVGWRLRGQKAVAMSSGEPEPDIAVVKGPADRYADHHPRPDEIAMIAEVADTCLDKDQGLKLIDYARNAIPVYWIVNLEDRQIEVYTEPTSPPGADPSYQSRAVYSPGQQTPLTIAGAEVGTIPVDDVLP